MSELGFSKSEIELAQLARAAGIASERERIIKLLSPLAEHDYDCDVGCYRDECSAGYFEHAISLMEEEQK